MEEIKIPQETKKELIVFDLYGTCLKLPSKSIKSRLMNTLKGFFKQEEVKKLKQIQKAQLIQEINMDKEDIEKKCGVKLTDSQFEKLKENTKKIIQGVKLYPDVLETLEYLKSKGYKIAIISNLGKVYEEPLRRLLDGKFKFDYEILSYKEGVKKPDHEIFEKLQEVSGYELKDMVMIGDSLQSDVIGAEKEGILPIHIKYSSDKMKIIECARTDGTKFECIEIPNITALKEFF